MSKDQLRRTAAKAALDRMIHGALGSVAGAEYEALQSLIGHLRRVSSLLRPQRFQRWHETVGQCRIVDGLVSLARHSFDWLRPFDGWIPGDLPPIPAFTSLAHHLFANYAVPRFMTSVWFAGSTGDARQRQEWFKLMGRGRNIRSADLPIPLTRSMAHHFCLAPDHFSVHYALRWGQIRGMGGNERLAYALIATRLGQDFNHDDFWKTVIQFFVNNPNLDLTHVGPIVEFLHHEKYEVRQGVLESGELGTLGPSRADLSLKGRSISSLLRDVREWRRRRGIDSRQPLLWWKPSPIGGFRLVDEDTDPHNVRLWTIREVLSSSQLSEEGKAMRNCVAGYARYCAGRWMTIWSLRVEDRRGEHRVLTIQVDPTARIIQRALRSGNRAPRSKDRAILQMWAQQEGLKLEC